MTISIARPVVEHTDLVRVLVVDDSDDQRLLLRTYFERAGCVVTEAVNAEEALVYCRDTPPDLAVIDLILPGMDGWALTHHLRLDRPDCVIEITSVLDAEEYPVAQAALPKPVTGAHVRQVLREWVPKWTER